MEKLLEQVKKELTEIEGKGINASNLELIDKLVGIYKDLGEIKKLEEGGGSMQDTARVAEDIVTDIVMATTMVATAKAVVAAVVPHTAKVALIAKVATMNTVVAEFLAVVAAVTTIVV